jgi:Glycosyl transferases group 1
MIAGVPRHGGATWAVLQYMLGFARLGHEVMFVEQCDQSGFEEAPSDRSGCVSYFREVTRAFGLEESAAMLLEGTQQTVGVPYERLRRFAADADLLVNISGILTDATLISDIPVRVYLDLDPAFNQLWQVSGIDMRFDGHTHFVTVGQAIGTPASPVPTCGRSWLPTVPPVVMEHWPPATRITTDAFTTIGNWRGYGSIEYEGIHYGQKAHSLRQFMSVPTRTTASFQLALAIHPDEKKDIVALSENGWGLLDPDRVAGTPERYRSLIQGSRGEFGIAKSGYVASRCGWFSDRSVCYLASGRPVIAQETGFSRFFPTGEGLFAFETSDDVLAAIEELRRDYPRHSQAARALAEEHFDSDKVLERFIRRVDSDE